MTHARKTLPEVVADAGLDDLKRRHFLRQCSTGLGAMFMGTLLPSLSGSAKTGQGAHAVQHLDFSRDPTTPLSPLPPQFAPRARRVVYLHMAGAPSTLELFDHKPELAKADGKDCPQSFLEGKTFAFISGVPKMLGPQYPFKQHGQSGAWLSDRLPHLAAHVDDLCFVRSMRTDQFNHAPAQLAMQTGNARLGNPAIGSWVTYGLGTENQNLPGFVVLKSGGNAPDAGKPLWGAGFLPSVYQGVECRAAGEPILYLDNPDGISRADRRRMLDVLDRMNQRTAREFGDPETLTRIAQYEMAFRMQAEASQVMDIGKESPATLAAYGAVPGDGSFASNCVIARRLLENDVRFVQLYHWGWDSHGAGESEALNEGFKDRCLETDRPVAALLADLKARGLLEDTLVVWGGEFGRTPMRENRGGQEMKFVGRDHNPNAFTLWMAGGGVNAGTSYGETDEMGYEVVKNPVEIRDLHATLLYLLGFDHHKLNFPFQGLEQKLTGVRPAQVVPGLLA
jgi:hypothetical protein